MMTKSQMDNREITLLKSKVAALEELLRVYEQTTIEQFDKLENALTSLMKRANELETVARVSFGVSTVLNTTELLQAVVDMTKNNFNLYHTQIYLLNEAGDRLKLAAGSGEVGRQLAAEGWQIPLKQRKSLVARAARTRSGVLVNDVSQAADWLPNPHLPRTCSELAVPMIVGDRILGVFDVQAEEIDHFTREDTHIQTTLASQIAISLENARLFEQAQQSAAATKIQARRLALLNEMATELSRTIGVEEVFKIVAAKTHLMIDGERCSLVLLSENGDEIKVLALKGIEGAMPVGTSLTLEGTVIGRAVQEKRVIVIADIRTETRYKNYRPNGRGICSVITAPLIISDQVIGALTVESKKVNAYDTHDEQLILQIASIVAATIENRRLFQQTEQALAETEILYRIGTQLNGVTNLDEILKIMTLPDVAPKLGSGALLLFGRQQPGWPQEAELVAASVYDESADNVVSFPIGGSFSLTDFPLTKLWLLSPDEPLLISPVSEDKRLDEELRLICQQANAQSLAVIPLTLGNERLGVASLVWLEQYRFTERDRRLYRSIAGQAAIVVNNLLLLRQAETRANQLEKLSRVENALSQATTEEEILTAVALVIEDSSVHLIMLSYIEEDAQGQPAMLTPISSWRDGAIWHEDPLQGQVLPPEQFPFAHFFIETPDQVMFINDLERDRRLDPATKTFALQLGIQAVAVVPLRSAGQWQGVIIFSWQTPHEFSLDEQFIFRQLYESAAAVVSSRRAYLRQQKALAETEHLYETIRQLNQLTDLQEVVEVIAENLVIPDISRVVLVDLERDLSDVWENVTVLAAWSRQDLLPVPIGESYPREMLTIFETLFSVEPTFLDDVQHDQRVDAAALIALNDLNISALAVLPLHGRNRLLGALLLEAEAIHYFSQTEKRFLTSLAQQMAVTIDNQRLLVETQTALAEAEVTQRRYTLQAWEVYQAKSRVHSYQRVRQGEISTDNDLPAEVSQAIIDKRMVVTGCKPDPVDNNSSEDGQALVRSAEAKIIAPLTVRDEVIGVLGVHENNSSREWLPEEIALVEAIAREIAQAAENLRLLDETQQRAAREKKVNEIGEKIQAAQTLEEALQIAIKEVGMSLNVPHTTVELKVA